MTKTKEIDVAELFAIHTDCAYGEVEEKILFELPIEEYDNSDKQKDLALFEINNLDGMRFESFMTDKTGETLIYLSWKDDREEVLYCVKINSAGVTILQILPKGGGENEVHS